MTKFDFGILIFIGVCFLFGLIGKAWKKHVTFIADAIALALGFFFSGTVAAAAYEKLVSVEASTIFEDAASGVTLLEYLKQALASSFSGLGMDLSSIESALDSMPIGVIQVVVFTFLTLVLMVVLNIIFKIVGAIITAPRRKVVKKAHTTIGIPSILSGAMVAFVLCFPVFVFGDLVAKVATTSDPGTEGVAYVIPADEEDPVTTTGEEGSFSIELITNSFFKKQATKLFSKDFFLPTNYEDNDGNKYNIYLELCDFEVIFDLLPQLDNLQSFTVYLNLTDGSGNIDLNQVEDFRRFMEGNLEFLEIVHDSFANLNDERSHVKEVLADMMISILVTMPDTDSDYAMFKCVDEADRQARIDAIESSNIKGLVPIIINCVLTSYTEQNPQFAFLADVRFASYEEVVEGIDALIDLFKVYANLFETTSDLSNVDVDSLSELIAGLADNDMADVIVGGIAEQFGFEIDLENVDIDWAKEAEAVEKLVGLATTSDLSGLDLTETAEVLASSTVALIAASTQDAGSITLSEEQYDQVQAAVAASYDTSSEEYATLMAIFAK